MQTNPKVPSKSVPKADTKQNLQVLERGDRDRVLGVTVRMGKDKCGY